MIATVLWPFKITLGGRNPYLSLSSRQLSTLKPLEIMVSNVLISGLHLFLNEVITKFVLRTVMLTISTENTLYREHAEWMTEEMQEHIS